MQGLPPLLGSLTCVAPALSQGHRLLSVLTWKLASRTVEHNSLFDCVGLKVAWQVLGGLVVDLLSFLALVLDTVHCGWLWSWPSLSYVDSFSDILAYWVNFHTMVTPLNCSVRPGVY